MAFDWTEEGRETIEEERQTILETLHSKLLILHITRFPHCRVINNNARIF